MRKATWTALVLGIATTGFFTPRPDTSVPIGDSGETQLSRVAAVTAGIDGGREYRTYLLVDSPDGNGELDATIDRVFVLQQRTDPGIPPAEFTNASVTWTSQQVQVMTDGELALVMRVSESTSESEVELSGFGLSHTLDGERTFPNALPATSMETLDFAIALSECEEVENCHAGGPGSTSCSISGCNISPTSCSVTCSTGIDACCGCQGYACCKCETGGN